MILTSERHNRSVIHSKTRYTCPISNGKSEMSGLLVTLVIQVIAGVIGGNGIGAAFKDASLGPAVNSIPDRR